MAKIVQTAGRNAFGESALSSRILMMMFFLRKLE